VYLVSLDGFIRDGKVNFEVSLSGFVTKKKGCHLVTYCGPLTLYDLHSVVRRYLGITTDDRPVNSHWHTHGKCYGRCYQFGFRSMACTLSLGVIKFKISSACRVYATGRKRGDVSGQRPEEFAVADAMLCEWKLMAVF
jgi:hypothetical protein